MTLRAYFSIFAVLSVLFGIGFVLAPRQVLINYGVETTPGTFTHVAVVWRDPARNGRHTLVC